MNLDEINVRTEKLFVVELEGVEKKYLYLDARIKHVGTDYIIITDDDGIDYLYSSEYFKRYDSWAIAEKEIRDFHEGLAAVCTLNDEWGFVNKAGKTVIKIQYKSVSDFHNGYAIVEDGDEVYRINAKGERIEKVEKPKEDKPYIDMESGIKKFLANDPNSKIYGVYNDLGIAVVYYEGKDFNEFVGCIDEKGNIVIKEEYVFGLDFKDGIAVTDNFFAKGYAFIKQTKTPEGKYVNTYDIVPAKFKTAREFINGMGAIQNFDNKWTFIKPDKSMLSNFVYKNAEDFTENGVARVQDKNDNWIYIDKNNKKIVRKEKVYVVDVPHHFRVCGLTKDEVLEKIKDYELNFKYDRFNSNPKKLKLTLV